jgi:tetratricopeptide (TPR) repeat protein
MPSGKVKVNTYNFGQPPLFTVIISFIFILIITGSILFIYFAGRVWLGDVNYVKALKARDKTENIANVEGYLEKAIKFNPYATDYHFVLAQAFATEVQLEAAKDKPDVNTVQNLSQKSINESKVGVDRDSKNPIVYENQASIFSSLRNILGNADQRAAEAYEKAVALEPNNSIVYLNLGRSYLLYAQSLLTKPNATQENKNEAGSNLDLAITNFKKSDSLKKDLPDARYNWALALELKGNLDEALSMMNKLVSDYPSNIDVIYALGQMDERNNKLDEAITIFNKIIAAQPNHSNSHWQLGLIYEQQKQIDKAIAEFETVQKLNPDNQTVKQKLDSLKNPTKKK